MDAVQEILAGIDSRQLAEALGTDEETAVNAAAAAIPALLGGLQANASAGGGNDLLQALGQHAAPDQGGRVDLNSVDTADGQKIVAHALADDPRRLQAVSGLGGGLLAKLLPLLAPIVMSYLARKLGMGGASNSGQGSGNLLNDLLGGLLGGSGAAPAQADAPAPQAPRRSDGPVFNPPQAPGRMQIPAEDPGSQPEYPEPEQQQTSGDPLRDLLGQILGR